MKNQLDYSEFIERYLDGEMEEMELIWFKKEFESNPVLQNEIELRRKINLAIADNRLRVLKSQLEEAYQEIEKQAPVRKVKPVLFTSAVASVLVGAVIIFTLLGKPSNESIFNDLYTPYESSLTFRSADAHQDMKLKAAMNKYQHGEYKEALVLFEQILTEDPSKVGLNFYSGISHMEEKNYENAGKSFNRVIADKYSLYYEQAEWYLALCYLVTEKNEKAEILFRKIASEDGFYKKQAKKALKKMK